MSSATGGSGRQRRAALMQGSSDNREYELAVVREAIAAKTDPALGADVPNAAEHLLRVLDDCEFRDARGKLRSRGNSTDLSWFFYFVWRRIMRYGFDGTQRSEARRWTFYLPAATGASEPWMHAHPRHDSHECEVAPALHRGLRCRTPGLPRSARARSQRHDEGSRDAPGGQVQVVQLGRTRLRQNEDALEGGAAPLRCSGGAGYRALGPSISS